MADDNNQITFENQAQKRLACTQRNFDETAAMAEFVVDHAAVRDRLTRLRKKALRLGFSKDMAERIGQSPAAYSYAESTGNLSREMAWAIVAAVPGVTLDWLWFGNEDRVQGWILKAIHSPANDDTGPSRGRPRTRNG